MQPRPAIAKYGCKLYRKPALSVGMQSRRLEVTDSMFCHGLTTIRKFGRIVLLFRAMDALLATALIFVRVPVLCGSDKIDFIITAYSTHTAISAYGQPTGQWNICSWSTVGKYWRSKCGYKLRYIRAFSSTRTVPVALTRRAWLASCASLNAFTGTLSTLSGHLRRQSHWAELASEENGHALQ